jgi:hypothetical protein
MTETGWKTKRWHLSVFKPSGKGYKVYVRSWPVTGNELLTEFEFWPISRDALLDLIKVFDRVWRLGTSYITSSGKLIADVEARGPQTWEEPSIRDFEDRYESEDQQLIQRAMERVDGNQGHAHLWLLGPSFEELQPKIQKWREKYGL